MNPILIKSIGGVVVLSTIGTGTYFGSRYLLRPETIRDKLNKEGFKFIKSGAIAQWNLEFESDKANIQKDFGVGVKDGINLEKECKKIFDSSNYSILFRARKWCGIRSISSQLSRSGKKVLVNDNSEGAEAKWAATYDKRKELQTNREKIGLSGAWPSTKDEDLAKIKTFCAQKSDLEYSQENIETYNAIEAWCTEEGKESTFK